MNTKKVYRYDEKGYFMYDDVAYESPLEPNVFPLPAYCTEVEPIKAKEGYKIRYNGEEWEYEEIPKEPEPKEPTLDELKTQKLVELKATRDSLEVEPITTDKGTFDFDEKARDRINSAIIALELQPENASIDWTTADNNDVDMNVLDLKMIISAVAVRSNMLHIKYRNLKEKVDSATTRAEVEAVIFN